MNEKAKIAIFAWEAGKVPKGLLQLETLKGNSTNPESFDFPIRIARITGANRQTILENPDRAVMERMKETAAQLEREGIKGITTSCGFNAIFQKEISAAVSIPIFTSSILQIPFIRALYGNDRPIVVLTAQKSSLKPEHFAAAGVDDLKNLAVYGMELSSQWRRMREDFHAELDLPLLEREVVDIALAGVRENPGTCAVLFECTDMPPFAAEVRERSGLPVFDFCTMTNYLHSAIA